MKNLVIQLILLFLVIVVFYLVYDNSLYAVLYGALVSLINAWLFNYFFYRKTQKETKEVKNGFAAAVTNSVLRMTVVAIMIILGLVFFKLEAMPLIFAFVIGQIGFIIDKVIQKDGQG